MRKTITAVLTVLLLSTATLSSVDAQPARVSQPDRVEQAEPDSFIFREPDPAKPAPIIPRDWVVLPMWGDVWANGKFLGPVDFVAFWQAGDPQPEAQLWALWRGRPLQVCIGDIFETPQGEPIFFGKTTVDAPAGTCHMARTPDFNEISLFIATEDGQWANSIMTNPTWRDADKALILG